MYYFSLWFYCDDELQVKFLYIHMFFVVSKFLFVYFCFNIRFILNEFYLYLNYNQYSAVWYINKLFFLS